MKQAKVLMGAVLAVVVVAGLYLINRYWIAPATVMQTARAAANRPMAPDFSLIDMNGRKIALADYKGKVVLLDFWATWCGPCRIEIPGFIKLQERYRDQGLVILGVYIDDNAESVREFYSEFKMNYAVAAGDSKIVELFGGIVGLPTTFLIGRDGRIYSKHSGATDVSVFEEEIKELLAAPPTAEAAEFKEAGGVGRGEQIQLGDPAEIDSEVPGVNLSKLTPEQVTQFKKVLEGQQCDCGCKLNLLKCRISDRSCGVSRRLAREQLEKFLKPTV
ncbi:MAG: TlpA family protein disulfide reductase [Terriglobia bacterium]